MTGGLDVRWQHNPATSIPGLRGETWEAFADGDYLGSLRQDDKNDTWRIVHAVRPMAELLADGRWPTARAAAQALRLAVVAYDTVPRPVEGLSRLEVDVLDFETCWPGPWRADGTRERYVRELLGHSLTRHVQVIANVLRDPDATKAAMTYAPATVIRLRKRQAYLRTRRGIAAILGRGQ